MQGVPRERCAFDARRVFTDAVERPNFAKIDTRHRLRRIAHAAEPASDGVKTGVGVGDRQPGHYFS